MTGFLSTGPRRRAGDTGMTLIEVAMSVGLLTFCAISLVGLFPTILGSMRESRDLTVTTRIFQATVLELENSPTSAIGSTPFYFDEHGVRVNALTSSKYLVRFAMLTEGTLPGAAPRSSLDPVTLTIETPGRNSTNLSRTILRAQ